MGLTAGSTGMNAIDNGLKIEKPGTDDRVIALAGNPNVGKSSVFNKLTGMHQHTGNWPGKTVSNAQGVCTHGGRKYILVDLPGTYSLKAHSREEEAARDFLCFGKPDAVIIVCDAACLERNVNLVLQTLEITPNVVVCVNMLDEAKKRGIHVDMALLSEKLGVPVIGTVAKTGKGLGKLMDAAENIINKTETACTVRYLSPVENALSELIPAAEKVIPGINPRWSALRLLEDRNSFSDDIYKNTGIDISGSDTVKKALDKTQEIIHDAEISSERLRDIIASCIVLTAEDICNGCITADSDKYRERDLKADKILTGRLFGIPVMIALLAFVFWLTISAANVPSAMLSSFFMSCEEKLLNICISAGIPSYLYNPLIFGVYHVLTWVVAVMLPPMAIFFPLFTLLEDLGYLPRIAFNLDNCFRKCSACGKQALTMCL